MVSAGFDGFQIGFRILRSVGPTFALAYIENWKTSWLLEKNQPEKKNNRPRRVSDSAKRVALSANLYLAILRNDMTQGKDKVSHFIRPCPPRSSCGHIQWEFGYLLPCGHHLHLLEYVHFLHSNRTKMMLIVGPKNRSSAATNHFG